MTAARFKRGESIGTNREGESATEQPTQPPARNEARYNQPFRLNQQYGTTADTTIMASAMG